MASDTVLSVGKLNTNVNIVDNDAHDLFSKSGEIQCGICKNIYGDRLEFEAHYKSQHKEKIVYTCPICKKHIPLYRSYLLHYVIHIDPNALRCKICSKKFETRRPLQIHIKSHSRKRINCDTCEKSFGTRTGFLLHISTKHRKDNLTFPCEICKKVLRTKMGLKTHVKLLHQQAPTFMCDVCGRQFLQKNNMFVHMRTHTGDNPFTCGKCNKTFPRQDYLKRHQKISHMDKIHKCSWCNKIFRTAGYLKLHLPVHDDKERPFACNHANCNQRFVTNLKLEAHLRTHVRASDKKLKCTYCKRTFSTTERLTIHMSKHQQPSTLHSENIRRSARIKTKAQIKYEITDEELDEIFGNEIKNENEEPIEYMAHFSQNESSNNIRTSKHIRLKTSEQKKIKFEQIELKTEVLTGDEEKNK